MKTISRHRRVAEAEETDSEGTWALSYGDMITLLLTFFILFFNINKDKDVAKLMQDSLVAKLTTSLERKPAFSSSKALSELSDLNVGTEKGKGIEEMVAAKFGAKIQKIGQRLLVEFPGVSFFKFGQTKVSAEGIATLKRFANLYVPYAGSYQLIIRAYTDEKPVRNIRRRTYHDNLELSLLRSLATVRALQVAGLPLNRMKPGGFGEFRIPASQTQKTTEHVQGTPMARKVLLMIEPEAKGATI